MIKDSIYKILLLERNLTSHQNILQMFLQTYLKKEFSHLFKNIRLFLILVLALGFMPLKIFSLLQQSHQAFSQGHLTGLHGSLHDSGGELFFIVSHFGYRNTITGYLYGKVSKCSQTPQIIHKITPNRNNLLLDSRKNYIYIINRILIISMYPSQRERDTEFETRMPVKFRSNVGVIGVFFNFSQDLYNEIFFPTNMP